jgi:hypothetical protein
MILIVIYFRFHYGITGLYERGLLYTLLLANIISGAGLAALRKTDFHFSFFKGNPHRIIRYGRIILVGLLVILVVITVVPQRQSTPYYKMIDNSDYQAFCRIRKHYGDRNIKALVDPWKGTAFTAVTGLRVTSRIIMAPTETDYGIYEFLDNECQNTGFLVDNDVSLIYTRQSCSNPDLLEVHDHVYIVRKD